MAKNGKISPLVNDPQRCEVCNTSLTLYPKVFATCPHCQRTVCRVCWGEAWAGKAFTAEACAHVLENSGLDTNRMGQRRQGIQWDWHKALFMSALVLLALGTLIFLIQLFVF